ncbi:hypothetical protein SSBR45G_62860 [Bradyrhizobium sp. SSBR45G]|uniref:hypothetical protein n=1 Tax=unclassified Bradyrhizobium TaxID=2631580 RepID=UPI002342A74C|nr:MULTISPECIES: hypothetical protein [unclassified Bradyrhizobium]GLH81377.1 hypothetical protein SSBR45G_62860 [Bradyrhizobium sp. SSBR45G]GLH85897.1 hypothetical protein SSBR45R_33570 [Bradyrhizobium sp. SSBR45R]
MVLRAFVGTIACAALLVGTEAIAGAYQPGEFFRLDLSRAVLAPEPLGPEAHFEPMPIEAKTDRPAVASRSAIDPDVSSAIPRARVTRRERAATVAERPRGAARARLAHRRSNLMDAQAMDTRIQTWPCRPGSGGICKWR